MAIATLSKWEYDKELLDDIDRLKGEIKTRLEDIQVKDESKSLFLCIKGNFVFVLKINQ